MDENEGLTPSSGSNGINMKNKKSRALLDLEDKLIAVRTVIDILEEDSGVDKCKSYNPDCANCKGQLLLGYLEWYLDLLEWEKENI